MRRVSGWPPPLGFTLIETVVASIGMLAIGAALTMLYTNVFQGLEILMTKSMMTGALQSAMERIGRDVQTAASAPTTCPPADSASPTRLILRNPAAQGGGHTIYQCNPVGDCNTLTPDNLERLVADSACAVDPTQTRVVASTVTSLAFTPQAANKGVEVRVGVRCQLRPGSFLYEATLTDLFTMRGRP